MKIFYLTFFLLLAAAATLNYVMDPASFWHKASPVLAEPIPAGQCLATRSNIDERVYKTRQLRTLPAPDFLLLSSSRGFQIRSSYFVGVSHFYNGAMSGAAVEDYAALWQELKESGKIPKRVVMFLDDSQLFDKTPTYRWHSVRGLVYSFLSPGLETVKLRKQAKDLSMLLVRLADLLSYGTLKQSVRDFREGQLAVNKIDYRLVRVGEKEPEAYCWGADGSLYYPDIAHQLVPETELRKLTVQTTKSKEMEYLYRYETSEDNRQILRKLLREFRENGVSVTIFIPPYQTDGYESLQSNPASSDGLARFRADVALLAREQSFELKDYLDPASLGCKNGDFMDIEHPIGNCIARIVSEIKEPPANPGDRSGNGSK